MRGMTMEPIYLGIDMGTASAKCLAVDAHGQLLALARRPYRMYHKQQDGAEQEPEEYWTAFTEVVGDCVQQCVAQGRSHRAITAMALSTQGDTLIVTDEQGTALIPALSWMDQRAQVEYAELLAAADQLFWYRETGNRLTVGSSACKARWLAAHQPQIWRRVQRIAAVPDYLAIRICGQFVTDMPSASWSPYFTPQTRRWSAPVLELLGISAAKLPRVVDAGAIIGPLLPDVAAQLGLTPDTLLVAGAFDQAAAALGAGAGAKRSVLSCGTAWVMYTVAATPPPATAAMLPICCHTDPANWGVLLPFTGGAAYEWCRQTFRCADVGTPRGETAPLYFLPYLYGVEAPDWQAKARGVLLGLTMGHTGAHIMQAVQYGIACEARRNVEASEAHCGAIAALRMVGGATNSECWPQIVANVLNRPVEVTSCAEAAAYGAAMLAAGSQAATWPEPAVALVSPIPEEAEVMDEYFARYRQYQAGCLSMYMQ